MNGLAVNKLEKYAICFLREEIDCIENSLACGGDFAGREALEQLLTEYKYDYNILTGE